MNFWHLHHWTIDRVLSLVCVYTCILMVVTADVDCSKYIYLHSSVWRCVKSWAYNSCHSIFITVICWKIDMFFLELFYTANYIRKQIHYIDSTQSTLDCYYSWARWSWWQNQPLYWRWSVPSHWLSRWVWYHTGSRYWAKITTV